MTASRRATLLALLVKTTRRASLLAIILFLFQRVRRLIKGPKMTATKFKPVPGFEALSNQIYVERPAADAVSKAPDVDPTTVLLYGWGDCLPKHLVKYTAGYRELYPRAKIIMVLSPLREAMRRSLEHKAKNMLPIVDEIFGADKTASAERILIECMSNTGGLFYAATLKAYEHRFGAGARMPHAMLLLDSTPGGVDFYKNVHRWARAVAMGVATVLPLPLAVVKPLCYAFLWANHLYELAIGREGAGSYATRATNDPEREVLTAKRAYFYSKEDDLIPYYDIEEHIADAKAKGYIVTVEIFEGSPHVGHMRMHPEQYWGAVTRLWTEAVALQKVKRTDE